MIISCGSNGQNGNGGHSHNDKLSFELSIDGKDIIVDPGTYLYTAEPELRNKFRSTAYHNTLMIDGAEQNRFTQSSLFRMREDAKANLLQWEAGGECDLFEGEHYGYTRLATPIVHRRLIRFCKRGREWEIKDFIDVAAPETLVDVSDEGKPACRIALSLILDPRVDIVLGQLTDRIDALLRSDQVELEFSIVSSQSKVDLKSEAGWYSPDYGMKQPTKLLRLQWSGYTPAKLSFRLKKSTHL